MEHVPVPTFVYLITAREYRHRVPLPARWRDSDLPSPQPHVRVPPEPFSDHASWHTDAGQRSCASYASRGALPARWRHRRPVKSARPGRVESDDSPLSGSETQTFLDEEVSPSPPARPLRRGA